MKTRMGFVSNSSSSSFVAIGIMVKGYDQVIEAAQKYGFEPTADSEAYEAVDYLNEHLPEGSECFDIDGVGIIVGKVLAKGNSDEPYLEDAEFSMAELYQFSQDVASKLDVPVSAIKLYIGEYSC